MMDLIDRAASLPEAVIYLITALLSFGESALLTDLVVPGETGLVFMGAVVERTGGSFVLALVACVAGAVAGDSVGFYIGRRWGWELLCRWAWVRRRLAARMARAEPFVARHPALVVFGGRWVGALRAVVPIVVGTTTLPYRRFLAWDLLAAVTWATAVLGLGAIFGESAARLVDRFGWWVTAAVVLAVAAHLLRRRRSRTTRGDGGRTPGPLPTARAPVARGTSPRGCR